MAHLSSFSKDASLLDLLLAQRKMSRRTLLGGLAGLTLTGGGITSFITSCGSPTNPSPASHTPTSPSRTALYTYRGHSDGVIGVAWSPDGKCIASGGGNFLHPDSSHDTMVQVWDAADGGHVYTYRGHSVTVFSVAWSPDGKRIASGSNDATVQVWDAVDGRHVYTYRGHADFVNAVSWSPDGKRIASAGGDKTVQVWDAGDGSYVYIYRGHSDAVLGLAWSPDGKHIVSGGGYFDSVNFVDSGGGDTTAQVWDAADGSHVYIYHGHSDLIWTVVWSPDGTRIASGSADKTVQVWRV